jgi:hypothetical protein
VAVVAPTTLRVGVELVSMPYPSVKKAAHGAVQSHPVAALSRGACKVLTVADQTRIDPILCLSLRMSEVVPHTPPINVDNSLS